MYRVDRRSVLKLGAAALPLASGAWQTARAATEGVKPLRRVDVAEDRITRKVAGLRPFRPSGFVVRAEALGDKTVIHNYGHGGCGETLPSGHPHTPAHLATLTPSPLP